MIRPFYHSHRGRLLVIISNGRRLLSDTTLVIECIRWHGIQSEHVLVWILYNHVLAITHLEHHVHDCADDAPSVGNVQVHLRSEFARLVAQDTEDDVVLR